MTADWWARYRGLVIDERGTALLLHRGDLPAVELSGGRDELAHHRPAVAAAFGHLLGTEVEVLRTVDGGWDDRARRGELVVELAAGGEISTAGLEWVPATRLGAVAAGSRRAVRAALHERATGSTPPGRQPWADAAWRATARRWIAEVAASAGREVRRIDVHRDWALSIVWHVELDVGAWYVKAGLDLPRFVDEGAVTAMLARRYPGSVPPPLAREPATGLFVTEDLGDVVGWDADAHTKVAFAAEHATFQRRTGPDVDALLAAGCLDRRPAVLERDLEGLLERPDRTFQGLTAAEVAGVRAVLPALRRAIRDVDRGVVPSTLVHGDAHLGNAVRLDGRPALIDWTDACVAHPFLDGHLLASLHGDDGLGDELRDATLAAWADLAAAEELRRLWALTAPVALLHQIVSYDGILERIEPVARPDLAWATPRFWRELTAALEAVVA